MKTKVKNSLIVVATLAAGYVAGALIGLPQTSGNLSSGDISKVSKYHKESVGTQHSAYEEKLLADSEAMENEVISTGVMAQKLVEFSNLVDRSVEAAGDIEELGEQVNALKELQELSANAAQTAFTAIDALENLKNGNNDLGITYEQASQNLMVAYMMVDNQARVGKDFAIAADGYYVNHRDLANLAEVRDSWAQFCCECALLKGTEEGEQKYWASNTDAKLSDLSSISILAKNDQTLKRTTAILSKNEQTLKKTTAILSKNNQESIKAYIVVGKMDANSVKMTNVISKNQTNLSRTISSLKRTDMAAQRAAIGRNEVVSRNDQVVKRTGELAGKNNNGQKKY